MFDSVSSSQAMVADPTPREPGQSSVEKLRVLAVDDNQDAANVLALTMRMLGCEVRAAYDGLAAVEVAGEFRPHIILMDIGMPKLNGFEAAKQIRSQSWGQDIVLVALTGWGRDEQPTSLEAGFNQHFVKPVEPSQLKQLLADQRATRTAQ